MHRVASGRLSIVWLFGMSSKEPERRGGSIFRERWTLGHLEPEGRRSEESAETAAEGEVLGYELSEA
jgi:hypothetical protein